MKLDTFFDNFGLLADAPNGVQKLREMILQMAVQGKLVPQDPKDEPASVLLEKIKTEKKRLIEEGKIRKQKPTVEIKEEEKPFVLPDDWQWCRLGDLGAIFNGNSLNSRQKISYSKVTNGLPYISTKHVGYGTIQIDYNGEIKIPLNEPKFKIAHKHSILICSEGGSAGRKIGIIDRDVCFGNKLLANETFSGVISKFIFYMYQSPLFLSSFKAKMTGIIGGISINNFLSLVTPLPPTAGQKRIVAKVDELMALCDQLEARKQKISINSIRLNDASINKLLTAREPTKFSKHWQRICDNFNLLYSKPENVANLRQAILQLAVQGKLVPQDPKDEPASALLERIKAEREQLIKKAEIKTPKPLPPIKPEEVSYELPEGWEWIRLGDITSPDRGVTYGIVKLGPEPDSGGIKTLRCSDVLYRKISTQNARSVRSDISAQYKRTILQGGELLMNIRGTLGGCGIVGEDLKGYNIAREVALIPLVKEIESRFILDVISSPYIQINTIQNLRGIAYKGLNLNILKNFLIPIPPLPEQKRIVAKVDELMALCNELETRLSKSQTDCDRLMEAAVAEILAVA